MIKRAIIIVLDSVGVGELPDADKFGDLGADTLGNISRHLKLQLPNFARLGLGNLHSIRGVPPAVAPIAFYGKMEEKSPAKDTTLGHWEIAGLISPTAFPTYPKGFPADLVKEFEKKTGKKTIGNKAASGTEIIKELGDQHYKTGALIIYTSADSVFQIAAHEEIVPLDELYKICQTARELLTGQHGVGRVIARPFAGKPGNFYRTPHRHDYSLPPNGPTLLDLAQDAGLEVIGVGKIYDIFAGRGITRSFKTESNAQGMETTLKLIEEESQDREIIFTNLVDFDMLFGHRNNPEGYALALTDFDHSIPDLLKSLRQDDVLFLTADHGCDPTITTSTDHSREFVPILAYGKSLAAPSCLGVRQSFADLGKTLQELLQISGELAGDSFAPLLKGES